MRSSEESDLEVLDTASLEEYLKKLTHTFEHPSTIIDTQDNERILQQFIRNPLSSSLFVGEKVRNSDLARQWYISGNLSDVSDTTSLVVIIKARGPILAATPIESQLQIVEFPNTATRQGSFEALKSLVNLAVAPYFNALAVNTGSNIQRESNSYGVAKRKIHDLAVSLEQLEQFIKVPDLSLTVHPKIREYMDYEEHKENVDENELLGDSSFLNDLQSIVNDWVKSVQLVSRMNHDPLDGSVEDEINFWSEKESALLAVQSQLSSPAVLTTLDLLRKAKRFHATVSFVSDTGVQDALSIAGRYNQLLIDLPIQQFSSSATIESLRDAVSQVFAHMKRLRVIEYPVDLAVRLVESFTGDISFKLREILSKDSILKMDYQVFTPYSRKLQAFFLEIDDWIKEFTQLCRELIRKRSEKYVSLRISSRVVEVQELAKSVINFRAEHQKSLELMQRASLELGHEDVNIEREITKIYVEMQEQDPFGKTSHSEWENSLSLYSEKIESLEKILILGIKGLLSRARSSQEMFSVFQKCEFLLEKLSIRHALQEYQFQLLSILKQEVDTLRRSSIENKESQLLLLQREVPEAVKQILVASQVENHCDELQSRLSLVLGPQWESYPDGRKVVADLEILRGHFNSKSQFQKWCSERTPTASDLSLAEDFILHIKKVDSSFELYCPFDRKFLFLIDEIRALRALGFTIPTRISSIAADTKLIYPYHVSVLESLELFKSVTSDCLILGDLTVLLSHSVDGIYSTIQVLSEGKWNHIGRAVELQSHSELKMLEELRTLKALDDFPVQIRDHLLKMEKLTLVADRVSSLHSQISQLNSFTSQTLKAILSTLQDEINELYFEGFANIDEYVGVANERLKESLISLSNNTLRASISALETGSGSDWMQTFTHWFSIDGQKMTCSPPLEYTKAHWSSHIQQTLEIILEQPMLSTPGGQDEGTKRLFGIQSLFPAVHEVLSQLHDTLEAYYLLVNDYWNSWLRLQTLWEYSIEEILENLADDISAWVDALVELKNLKLLFEGDGHVTFGAIKVDISLLKENAESKHSSLTKALASRFAEVVGFHVSKTGSFLTSIQAELDASTMDISSANSIIALIVVLKKFSSQESSLKSTLDNILRGDSLLRSYNFRISWSSSDLVESQFEAVVAAVKAKRSLLVENSNEVSTKIKLEYDRVINEIDAVEGNWLKQKASHVDVPSSDALSGLATFEKALISLLGRMDSVCMACEFMNLQFSFTDSIPNILRELQDLRAVWSSLDSLTVIIDDCGKLLWNQIDHTLLESKFNDAVNLADSMPIRVKRHPAFQTIKSSIQSYQKTINLVLTLASESFKERHWRILYQKLHVQYLSPHTRTLEDVWKLNLADNAQVIQLVVDQAHGEATVEKSLAEVNEKWTNVGFEFFEFDSGVKLVKGWEDLFDLCSNDLSLLESMRTSQFYDLFEQQATVWEEKLNRIFAILHSWVDVQRHWIQLHGAFSKNKDIKALLPIGAMRYQNLGADLFSLLQPIYTSGLVVDILEVKDIEQKLEALLTSLKSIHQILNDYLDRQRESWPRFYFLNNEDLLDIVGNANTLSIIGHHIAKMFSGISNLITDETFDRISGVVSPEGEVLSLKLPILYKERTLIGWLTELEQSVKYTLSCCLEDSINELNSLLTQDNKGDSIRVWVDRYPCQVLILTVQVIFTQFLETDSTSLGVHVSSMLNISAGGVKDATTFVTRRKLENLIIELVHYNDVLSRMERKTVSLEFVQRFYYDASVKDIPDRLTVTLGTATLNYGFEYWGLPLRLVYTPLMEKSFLAMTEALDEKKGGSLVGPAGSGKTESVKALGQNLGRMVLVFCCDESFDHVAMSRILTGVCKVGVWGCFDEFNRLDVNTLSAVATQIEQIENALSSGNSRPIELNGGAISVDPSSGLFITSNPDYAGRSELPENLKVQYRTMIVSKPDTEVIADVLLRCQGFFHSSMLARNLHKLFVDLASQCSKQTHYDFGLRALKSVVMNVRFDSHDMEHSSVYSESLAVLESLTNTVLPKLISEDVGFFVESVKSFNASYETITSSTKLVNSLENYVKENHLKVTENWMRKASQLYEIQKRHKGIILFGEQGIGKTVLLSSVMAASEKLTCRPHKRYTIDPKVLSKNSLYGSFDPATREWKDGIFTRILRETVVDNGSVICWIVFDGDVDPDWVESLNSVLDDNGTLTLANGERLVVPPELKIFFEVDSLKSATPATVSRCGIVWLGDVFPSVNYIYEMSLTKMRLDALDTHTSGVLSHDTLQYVHDCYNGSCCEVLKSESLNDIFSIAQSVPHVMEFGAVASAKRLLTMLRAYRERLIAFVLSHPSHSGRDFSAYSKRSALLATIWAFTGDLPSESKSSLERNILNQSIFASIGPEDGSLASHYDLELPAGNWISWATKVPETNLAVHQVLDPSIIIPTPETVKHASYIDDVIKQHCPLILCGPPGSGKTMLVLSALSHSSDFDFLGLNFSKDTTPDLILGALEHHCSYKSTARGLVLSPKQSGKWIVMFCDEINLPSLDAYGTQHTVSLLRQIIEHGGFWRPSDQAWVHLKNVQFVGACNPPTDSGRNPLSPRFLRHFSIILMDYPGRESLSHIYRTFIKTTLKLSPGLVALAGELTEGMIRFYEESKLKFSPMQHSHYVFSPRELTRWVRGIFEALKSSQDELDLEGLVRLWAHEALRLFQDRLVTQSEKDWSFDTLKGVVGSIFDSIDIERALKQPILFSDWLSFSYSPATHSQLRSFLRAKLRIFCEEELSVNLILYDELIEHVLRINRVLRQPQGHMMLVGPTGSGKTTITKFVAWMNGIEFAHLTPSRAYSLSDFDSMLRDLIKRCGVEGRKSCLLIDDSAVLSPVFLERLNTLLANAEIPGLFEGEDLVLLIANCRDKARSSGVLCESEADAQQWLRERVAANIHIVLTTSDPDEKHSTQFMSSPALFNRFVVDWMGDWSDVTLREVSGECAAAIPISSDERELLVEASVVIHRTSQLVSGTQFCTPTKFLCFLESFERNLRTKGQSITEQHHRVNLGLDKLRESLVMVKELKNGLSAKRSELHEKDREASYMLEKILAEQSEAEKKQEASLELQVALKAQEEDVAAQKYVVEEELSLAEPAVIEAQSGVRNIKKQHLTELRAMLNPPEPVKITLESVCILLGYGVETWRDVQLVVRKDDFIASIVNFDNEVQLTPDILSYMEEVYLSRPDYNYEAVNRASKACGPLLGWVVAQIKYASVLERIGPLREEVQALEVEANHARAKVIAVDGMISDLKQSIESYKNAYGDIVREAERIKSQVTDVEEKVSRSFGLLESLSSERARWAASIEVFRTERACLVGNSLLIGASLAYFGDKDQGQRVDLMKRWSSELLRLNSTFSENISLSKSLASSSEILSWRKDGLQDEELFVENTIIMKTLKDRFNFLVDPSGSMIAFLSEYVKPKKLIVTSFLNRSFTKQLENSMRFGSALLITDGEYYDPIINRIISREFFNRGTRTMVKVGEADVDISAEFQLYIHTRDSTYPVPAFVASRTNFVNFSFSFASMESQALNMILSAERPDIENQKEESVRVQGEYKVRLQSLEDKLLQSLAESDDRVLENRQLWDLLSSLKTEAGDLSKKIAQTADVVMNITSISDIYRPLASGYALLFELLTKLQSISPFYQIPITFYNTAFMDALGSRSQSSGNRVQDLLESFGRVLYQRLGASVFYEDHMLVAMILLFTALKVTEEQEANIFMRILQSFTEREDIRFTKLKDWLDIELDVSSDGLTGDVDEPSAGYETLKSNTPLALLIKAAVQKNSSPGLLRVAIQSFPGFDLAFSNSYTLENVIQEDLPLSMPLLICSPDKYDARIKLNQLAKLLNKSLVSTSMGSSEGEAEATKNVVSGAKNGRWVLIQNIHMAPNWVSYLEKTLGNLQYSPGFKLFLTCTSSTDLPLSLLKAARIVAVKTEPGIKNLFATSFFSTIGFGSDAQTPEVAHMYLLLCWFHCIVLERLMYLPVGWSKAYDFGESDLLSAKFVVDCYLRSNEVNGSLDHLEWSGIAYLIGTIVYGGKIDSADDLKSLEQLAQHVFSRNSTNHGFSLVQNSALPLLPVKMDIESIREWAENLPVLTPVSWLGIPESAEVDAKWEENRIVAQKATKILGQ
ncbi:unnamed protein product [Kuraishia capsulata CBS 1993]|uniref:Dynein heavy chain, cytoplasmic n=1 Tax=Kuraishia capsulata CBS 1993 TaxID=1382522 RepID=W6MVP6_9ASCO|nr:uncharacterized protein KUCA_T00002382001 [Kuraishia capsulata CBS 1993]CDK26410.1 unnamed protein product [Kuraishia capsulata CBS 1993]